MAPLTERRGSRKTCKLKMHTLHLPLNGGIGVAVQAGYRFAAQYGGYEYVLQFDADGQHEAAYIEPIVEACRKNGLDLCVGSRFLTPREGDFQSTFTRRLGIRMLATQIRLLSGFKATDPTSGFRCAGPRVWRSFAQRYPDDYPEPESIFWCARNKLKIGEIPVRMRERQGGQSSIRTLQTTYYMIKVMGAICVDGLRTKELTEP